MTSLDNKILIIDGSHVATTAVIGNSVQVTKLPACSIGTYLMILSWVRDLGYEVI